MEGPVVFPIEMKGLDTLASATNVYPSSPDLSNVRKLRHGGIAKRTGYTTYNATAMPATVRAITGVASFARRDTTTRYTIVGDQEKLFVCPTSGSWTTLASSLGGSATDYWDFAVFNNEIICVNGVSTPQVSDGTAGGTSALTVSGWQTKTTSPQTRVRSFGAAGVDGRAYDYGGFVTLTSGPANMEMYDVASDTWQLRIRPSLSRYDSMAFTVYGRPYAIAGQDATSLGATGLITEQYAPGLDVWMGRTAITNNEVRGIACSVNNNGYIFGGTDTKSQSYDPATDAWTQRTAVNVTHTSGGGWATGQLAYITTGDEATPLTTAREYNPYTNAYTILTAITNARNYTNGANGSINGIGYVVGGSDIGSPGTTTVQSYTREANAWTQESGLPASRAGASAVQVRDVIVHHAGATTMSSPTPLGTTFIYNVGPSAPVASYIEVLRGYVLLARTAAYPSRVYYCLPGDARRWPTYNYFDVNNDDGDWITGIFVYRDDLYVSKRGIMYRIPFSRLDPVKGDHSVLPLSNVPGTLSNRSIVVTDTGVYYLAEDGIRRFDGANSHRISEKIQPTLDGYVASRNKYVCGTWWPARDEIWWSFTSTGSTHDTMVVYNTSFDEWYIWSGIAAEAMGIVEDANDDDQLLFGTGSASDGKLYKADSTANDNGSAINAYYQTGWFAPVSGLHDFAPDNLYLWTKRSGAWNLTVQQRTRYSATVQQSDSVNLLSGSYPGDAPPGTDTYFQDGTELRCRIKASENWNGYALSVRFSNAVASQDFEIYAAVVTGTAGTVDGVPA